MRISTKRKKEERPTGTALERTVEELTNLHEGKADAHMTE